MFAYPIYVKKVWYQVGTKPFWELIISCSYNHMQTNSRHCTVVINNNLHKNFNDYCNECSKDLYNNNTPLIADYVNWGHSQDLGFTKFWYANFILSQAWLARHLATYLYSSQLWSHVLLYLAARLTTVNLDFINDNNVIILENRVLPVQIFFKAAFLFAING